MLSNLADLALPAINANSMKLRGKMRKWFLPGAVLLALALSSCDKQTLINMFSSPAQDKAGRAFFEDVRTGNFAPIRTAIDPALRTQVTPEILAAMRNAFGLRPVKSIETVNARIIGQKLFGKSGNIDHELTFEYDMGDRYVIAEILLRELPNHLQIEAVHVQPIDRPIEQINAFTFSGKSAGHFAFLALAIAIPIFILVTAVKCWRTNIPRRKWLWRIFVLFGILGIKLNWTTGEMFLQLVQFDLLGAGFKQDLGGPVLIQFSMPIGALLFWLRRRAWMDRAERTTSPSGPQHSPEV
jgi:hypothetical protein